MSIKSDSNIYTSTNFSLNETSDIKERIQHFLNPIDGRYEDLKKGNFSLNIFRDFTAGLIVAMVAIPLAMGFAMASGLRPEQGIVGGAIAGLIGALFGGSKYQVYGPTAAFIPVIAAIMLQYDYSFLVLTSLMAGTVLCILGLGGLGRFAKLVPHSIIVGFTIGIALVIATSQIGEVLGLKQTLGSSFFTKIKTIMAHLEEINPYAVAIAGLTFFTTKYLLRFSVYIPAPLLAIGIGTLASATIWNNKGLTLVHDKYGKIPTTFFVFTPPSLPTFTPALMGDFVYFTFAIVFVSAVESVLCSRMADRLANNQGIPFNPNKELWGQGMVNVLVPLFNGFPHTGALARTATNIKVGALSPLAGIFKCILKLGLAAYLATYLELVPMACIGGILLYVATAMVKPAEVKQVFAFNRFHVVLMVWTAMVVLLSDFLTGVLSGLAIYAVASLKFPQLNKEATENKRGFDQLLRGVLKFRKRSVPEYGEKLTNLALGQKPIAFFLSCADSRVVPDLITSTDPGDIFVIRNVGNLVPKFIESVSQSGEVIELGAAIDFAIGELKVKEIIICGHSNCGAMNALLSSNISSSSLEKWLMHGKASYDMLKSKRIASSNLSEQDELSQINVLVQMEQLLSYPLVREKVDAGFLRIHGWWFDIKSAQVLAHRTKEDQFIALDRSEIRQISKE